MKILKKYLIKEFAVKLGEAEQSREAGLEKLEIVKECKTENSFQLYSIYTASQHFLSPDIEIKI